MESYRRTKKNISALVKISFIPLIISPEKLELKVLQKLLLNIT